MKQLLALSVVVALAGCATKGDVRALPNDSGVAATYTASLEKARTCSRDSLAEAGFTVKEDETAGEPYWRLLATRGSTAQIARVTIEDKKGSAVVRVIVRSRVDSREAVAGDLALAEDIQKRIGGRITKE